MPFVIIGLRLASKTLAEARGAQATRAFRAVPATVLACEVKVEKDSEGDKTFDVDVHYTYEYAGVRRESRTLTRRALAVDGRAGAEAICQKLLAATNVRAYVDPQQPDSAVLITGVSAANYIGVLFGLTFAGFAFMTMVMTVLGNAAPEPEGLLESYAIIDSAHD